VTASGAFGRNLDASVVEKASDGFDPVFFVMEAFGVIKACFVKQVEFSFVEATRQLNDFLALKFDEPLPELSLWSPQPCKSPNLLLIISS